MPRFVTSRDYEFIQHITRELIDDTMDVAVILYKIVLDSTKINIYGESMKKPRYTPVKLNAVIQYNKNIVSSGDGFGITQDQRVNFRFARRMLSEVKAYPEIGDIIKYNSNYYEINNIQETQLIAGKPQFNTAVICVAHLTRKTALDIEEIQL
jgi:hypothetical protein